MINAIQMGIITESTKERLEQLEIDKKTVQEQIAQEELQKPMVTKEQIISYIKSFRNTDPDNLEACKHLVDIFINRIYLYDDKIMLIYNYKDDTYEINLNDIHDEIGSDLKTSPPPNFKERCFRASP